MGKITKVNIAAARAQRDILVRRGKPVPGKIQQIAEIDPESLPVPAPPEAPRSETKVDRLMEVFAESSKRLREMEASNQARRARIGSEGATGYFIPEQFAALPGLWVVGKDELAVADHLIHDIPVVLRSRVKSESED